MTYYVSPFDDRFLHNGSAPTDTENGASDCSAPDGPAHGRAQKAAWRCVTQALLKLRTENPAMPRQAMADEAWKRAAQEFDEADQPSVATIQRKMGEILRAHSH